MTVKKTDRQLLIRRPNLKEKKGFTTPGKITQSSRIKYKLYLKYAKKLYRPTGHFSNYYVNILEATKNLADALDKIEDVDIEDIVDNKTVKASPAPSMNGMEVACEAALQYFLIFPLRSVKRKRLIGSMFFSLLRDRVKNRHKKSPHF